MKIYCPKVDLSKKERIDIFFSNVYSWFVSEEMCNLVSLFNGKDIREIGSLKEIINYLSEFSKIWDFRNGKERWNIKENEFILANEDYIFKQVSELGYVNRTTFNEMPDYVLPLGGARMANYSRVLVSKEVVEQHNLLNIDIVALAGGRELNSIEMPYVEEYAPSAITEFDAINGAIRKVFDVFLHRKDIVDSENSNSISAQYYYEEYRNNRITSLLAASPDPARRANSLDTFNYFINKFEVQEKAKILLVTSSIYIPYQLCKFMEIAFDRNLYVECIGTDQLLSGGVSRLGGSSYLQEVKGTIDAIKHLYTLYY